MADEKKHDHKHCESCEAHRKAEREDLRERLKKCCEAREAARTERETQMAEELEAAQAEASSLKKKLAAFQLATVVGVTILGQDTFDKIMGKVDEVKAVQEKITGGGKSDPKDEKPVSPSTTKPVKTGLLGGWDSSSLVLVNGSDSGRWIVPFRRPSSAFNKPVTITQSVGGVGGEWDASASSGTSAQLQLPPVLASAATPTAPFSGTDWTQYIYTIPSPDITSVAVALNTEVQTISSEPSAFATPVVSAVPSPNTFSVFALSLFNNGRRRIA